MIVKQYTKDSSIYRTVIIWKQVIIECILWLFAAIILSCLGYILIELNGLEKTAVNYLKFVGYIYFLPEENVLLRLFMLILTIIIVIRLKSILVFTVYLYQKFAPESIRSSCRFTPSCSQYMIMAIEKYGVFIGVLKGLRRLSRCHAPNGGHDYP